MKVGLPLMKNVLTPLPRNILLPLGITAATLATDSPIQKKTHGSDMAVLKIYNKEMDDIIKIVKSLEESGLLKGVTETIKMKQKNRKVDFLTYF